MMEREREDIMGTPYGGEAFGGGQELSAREDQTGSMENNPETNRRIRNISAGRHPEDNGDDSFPDNLSEEALPPQTPEEAIAAGRAALAQARENYQPTPQPDVPNKVIPGNFGEHAPAGSEEPEPPAA